MKQVELHVDGPTERPAVVYNSEWVFFCYIRHTDSEKPELGWITILPQIGYELAALGDMVKIIMQVTGKEVEIYKMDDAIELSLGDKHIARLEGEEIKPLSAKDGRIMKMSPWINEKGESIRVTIHSEEKVN